MKKKIIKGLIYLTIGFIVLFTLRLIYGYITHPDGQRVSQNQRGELGIIISSFTGSTKNYANKKMSRRIKDQVFQVDQKYEKIATASTQTKAFKKDEEKTRKTIKKFSALIQFEQRSGLKRYKNRKLRLAIGVHPDKFDDMIAQIKTIGKTFAIQIDKTDKTNEFKDLSAKRRSLNKTRESLIALKKQGGKIMELIRLEDRILQVEESIQGLGVKLGEFDAENEFCTIKFTLQERVDERTHIPFIQRFKVALVWTVWTYVVLIIILFLASLSVLFVVILLEKLKWLPNAMEKYSK
ncbi:MAG: hypothetical protein IEMM0008_1490 [bacterium]|nr:MAG: hypothetical protein IEMM0008_1490 [bacterium]